MNIYIPSVVTGADCKCFTEIFSVIPFINKIDIYDQITDIAGYWNEGLYSKLFLNPLLNITHTEIAQADIVIIPFKYSPDDIRITKICDEAKSYSKHVVAFYNDDNSGSFTLPDNLFLFRTSATKSTLSSSERILPVLIPDHKPGSLILNEYAPSDMNIGFCGHIEGVRRSIVEKMLQISTMFKPIIRHGFWAPGMCKIKARREYYGDMRDCAFTLCMRGGGNFSYRFYEALSFGRIPILIDTDIALPYEENIKWNRHIIRIPIDTFMDMTSEDFISMMVTKKFSPASNRQLWERYFSPEGYLDNLLPDEITYLLHTKP